MSLPASMARSLEVLQFQRALSGAAGPTGPAMKERFERIVATLAKVEARWVLIGAHAVNAYARPRATSDFDIVVENRKLSTILRALEAEFGVAEASDIGPAVRIRDLDLDLVKSGTHALFHLALAEATVVEGTPVPPPEVLLALKFLAAVSTWRDPADRKQDAADLIRVYQATSDRLDRDAAIRHTATAYPGADQEFRALLDRIDRGEDVAI